VEAPEVVRHGVRLAEHDHERVPALAREQHAASFVRRATPSSSRASARACQPGPVVTSWKSANGTRPTAPLEVAVERARVDEGAVDRGRQRAVEAATMTPTGRLGG